MSWNEKILGMIEGTAAKHPEKIAVKYKTAEYTYKRLKEEIDEFSSRVNNTPVSKDWPVGIFIKNTPEFIIGYYALAKSGIVSMLIDHSLKSEELSAIAKDCHLAGFLIHKKDTDSFPLIDESHPLLEYGNLVLLISDIKGYNRPYDAGRLKGMISCRFSSGTTGLPKCMMYTEENVIAAATNWKTTIGLCEDDSVLCAASYTHGLAFNTSMLAPLSEGSTIFLTDNLMPHSIVRLIAKEKITVFVAFPPLYQLISEERIKDAFDLNSLRLCVSSGTVLHADIKRKFKENAGIHIADLYGVAETGLCILNTTDNVDTIGKALKNVEIRLFDDDGNQVGAGHEGQIGIKTASMSKGYYNFPGLLEEKITRDGFYLSGDIAVTDDNGYIYVKGRKQDFIDVGGKKVDPKEVEEALLRLHGVADTAVFGKKSDKTHSEILCAAIVASTDLDRGIIADHLQRSLASYKIPQQIVFLEKLPRNSYGKVLRRELSSS